MIEDLYYLFQGINSIELASDAIAYLQKRFYADFPKVQYT